MIAKKIIWAFFAMLLPFGLLGHTERKEIGDYHIESDVEDNSVPAGFCKISGVVKSEGKVIAGVNISSFASNMKVTSDSEGRFEIMVDTSENGLYTDHAEHKPAYFENYKFLSGHLIKMVFHIKKPSVYNSYPHAVKKPVIYAYGEAGTTFNIAIETEATITFTYPNLDNNWKLTIATNGMLEDKNKQQYPYLFWEGDMKNLNFQQSESQIIGNIVERKNTIAYLEEKLEQLGFNANEKTDFIIFWAPLMEQHDKTFVQFLVDEDYNDISTMEITPQPNNIRRVYILFTDAKEMEDHFIDQPLNFTGFDRNGFTILEWGGTELNNLKKL